VYATDDRDYLDFSNDIPQSADHLHLMEELKNEKLEKEAENFVPLKLQIPNLSKSWALTR